MPSWAKSYWIAFWSVIVGFLLSIFWIIVAGLVIATYWRFEIHRIVEYVEQNRVPEIFQLPETYFLAGIVVFFLILSSLSFYAVLVKYTWNEVYSEIKKELDKIRPKDEPKP